MDIATVPSEQKEGRSGTIKRGQHPVEVPIGLLKCLQQVTSQYQTRLHCLAGSKLKSICRTVQVLLECLRLRKVPAVHCNIAKTKDQPEIQNTDREGPFS